MHIYWSIWFWVLFKSKTILYMRMLNRTKSSKLNKIQQITSSISDNSIRYILVGETNESYPILYTGKINNFF